VSTLAAVLLAGSVLGTAWALTAPAVAATSAAKKFAKPTGLSSGITRDHSDPRYVMIVPTATWQNCYGAIRKANSRSPPSTPIAGSPSVWVFGDSSASSAPKRCTSLANVSLAPDT